MGCPIARREAVRPQGLCVHVRRRYAGGSRLEADGDGLTADLGLVLKGDDTIMAIPRGTQPGRTAPLGSTVNREGVNFSVFSKSSTHLELLFFDRVDDGKPSVVIPLDPVSNRTYHYWHVFVPSIQPGQIYGYRAFGPFKPDRGLRFDPEKVLLDPYAKAMAVPDGYSRISGVRTRVTIARPQ